MRCEVVINRYCLKCEHNHRFYSRPWIKCFGIVASDSNLYANGDRISKVFGHADAAFVGGSLKQFVDEYESYFNMGITISIVPNT